MTERADALSRTIDLIVSDAFGPDTVGDPYLSEIVLDELTSTTVRLSADNANLSSYAGQTAFVTLFGLVAMMGLGVELDIPEIAIVGRQPPLYGDELRAAVVGYGNDLIPGAHVRVHRGPVDAVFAFGDTPATPDAIRISGDDWSCLVARNQSIGNWANGWPFGALAAAGAAAPEAFRVALDRILRRVGREVQVSPGFELDPGRVVRLDLSVDGLSEKHLRLGDIDVVSGGAITTSALYTFARVPGLAADFRVIEPEAIELPNLNRYSLARQSDCGRPKVEVLQTVQSAEISVTGVRKRFESTAMHALKPMAKRVIVGVDDIPSRWDVQRATNRWLSVGATSHFYVLVTTHRPGAPCAGCLHPRDEELPGTIPTISFVSFWAGLMLARSVLVEASGSLCEPAVNVSPTGLSGPHALHFTGTSPNENCPVRCEASRSRARGGSP